MADFQANDLNTCVVCFKNVLYYSIGECDHPVCSECSTRMRVLCLQNECPICRQGLSRVVFTETIEPYKELKNDKLFDKQFQIGFCTEKIKESYDTLLEHSCKLCEGSSPFRSFSALCDHMRKVHERFYCDLCVKHLRIFTNERKCYTRQELARHRRKGDVDDTSQRGHPLCEFCEERFMDADELYRHLRKEHLYCHLCDVDGRNHYYATHAALAHHFRTEHYLCEEGECADQHLTSVFRTEIDLKAHKASVHGRGLARAAARQARTLELQFNITPHPVAQRTPRSDNSQNPPRSPTPPSVAPAHIDTCSDEQFPRLSTTGPPSVLISAAPGRNSYRGGADALTRNDRNFPALEGGPGGRPSVPSAQPPRNASQTVAATIVKNSKPSVSIQLHSQPASASNFRLTQASGNRISIPPQQKNSPLNYDDFPSLGLAKDDHPNIGSGSTQAPKISLINSQEMQSLKKNNSNQQSKKSQLSTEAFPALTSAPVPTAPPQWITVSKSKEKSKALKKEPVTQPRETTFNPIIADFPILPANSAKSKGKKQVQVQPPASQVNTISKSNSKKEKKKQTNVKKEHFEDFVEYNDFNDISGSMNGKKSIRDALNNNNQYSSSIDKKIKTVNEAITSVPAKSNQGKNTGNGDFAIKTQDYPPLNPKSVVTPTLNMNGTKPTGFAAKMRPPCDGMTFTNSAGETFPAPLHSYIPPPDFENRNRALVNNFSTLVANPEMLNEFKVASRAFRDSILSAEEFYQHCVAVLGTHLDIMFPELVALLPDIAKQQELVVGRKARALMQVCSICGQLVSPCDSIAHDTAHWPPL